MRVHREPAAFEKFPRMIQIGKIIRIEVAAQRCYFALKLAWLMNVIFIS